MLKSSLLLRLSNSRILKLKNAKFSGYYLFMNKNMGGDFKTCISVPSKFNCYS